MAEIPPLPPGFTLDQGGDVPPLPPGFTLDQPAPRPKAYPNARVFGAGTYPKPGVFDSVKQTLADQPREFGQAVKNVAEAGAEAATGITGSIAGDVAGLGTLVADVATFGKFGLDPYGVRERVREATTYRPADPNNQTAAILRKPGEVMTGAGEYMAGWTDNPYAQHVLRAVPQAAASLMGAKAAAPVVSKQGVPIPSNLPKVAPQVTPEQVAIKTATDAGYRLTPTQVGNKLGGAAEGISGQAALERSLSQKNVTITDNLAKKALGIADDKPLNSATIGIERAKANKAYDALAKTGVRKTSDAYRQEIATIDDRTGAGSFAEDVPQGVVRLKEIYGGKQQFNAADAVAKIRQLRADAKANFKTRDPEKTALGHAQQKVADALDNELERHADDIGAPELAANYKAARKKLAQLRTVEDSLAGTNVSAKKIWQQWKRGAPLEGNLLTIARTYDSFSHVLQEASKIRQKQPFSVIDAFVAAGGAAVNPALVATVAARPLTRAALASKAYQSKFVQPKGRAAAPAAKDVAPSRVIAPATVGESQRARR